LSADISHNRFFVFYIQRHGLTPSHSDCFQSGLHTSV